MPRLARFWDSLENDRFVETPRKSSTKSLQSRWLLGLADSRDDESQTILYAKPLARPEDFAPLFHDPIFCGAQRISVGPSKGMLSASLGNLSAPPPKPQRRIARLRSSANDSFNASLPQLAEKSSFSTFDILDRFKSNTTLCSVDEEPFNATSSVPEAARIRNLKLPGFTGSVESALASSTSVRRRPPSYEEVQISRRASQLRPQSTNSSPRFSSRHTIAVNQQHVQAAQENLRCREEAAVMSSPKSTRSDSSTSVDSGQCSGDVILSEQRSVCSTRQDSKDEFGEEEMAPSGGLPSYARMASTMDHVLRTSSAVYTLLSTTLNPQLCRDLLAKSSVFVQLVETSPCADALPKSDMAALKTQIADLQRNQPNGIDLNNMNNCFAILLRKNIEQVLQIFTRIICKYLAECGNKDRLVTISLEHLIHICLFGDELCLEAIQRNCITSALKMIRQPSTPEHSVRFLLRTLAVVCGVSKGALSLLSQGGLDLVLHHLLSITSPQCSIESAGILTQLTNPQHSFVRLTAVQPIVSRLLDLIDTCSTGDSLLLATAALNNVALQHPNIIDILFKHNAIQRFISAYHRENCSTIFVQEQIVTALSRLAARRYEEALVGQNAVPVLLEMLSLTHPLHVDYCRRIRYKAAVCIGTLANTNVGLKSLYENQAYAILSNVLYDDQSAGNPFNMICASIRSRLEAKYQAESAV
ncbi:unnamed protein product [Caenorhabditis auriculariae]|uniref:Protein inscuteable homologue C-terminal domain-containing protein n=1 Tax=Caenorhabditis auriculariae TaxID=2777116 RepID=A0A8S1HCF2_9PELO|nr:unnamed protein product [Caenorhabditis auriculariae]